MKCNNCGTFFKEGIFCPECGMKVIDEDSAKSVDEEYKKLKEENGRLKEENLLMEQQRKEREKEEKEKMQKRLEEAERLIQESESKDLENRTVRGTVYKTEEEAMQAKAEHASIDILKEQLMLIKSQERRKEVFYEFKEELHYTDTRQRYELLKVKVETPKPTSEKIINIYGISVLLTFMIYMILSEYKVSSGFLAGILIVCLIWSGFGLWIWIIWKIVLSIKRKKGSYYGNLSNI